MSQNCELDVCESGGRYSCLFGSQNKVYHLTEISFSDHMLRKDKAKSGYSSKNQVSAVGKGFVHREPSLEITDC